MTLQEIKDLDNYDLLELYAKLVRVEHYDPYDTPIFAKDLWQQGIDQDTIAGIVRERMDYAPI